MGKIKKACKNSMQKSVKKKDSLKKVKGRPPLQEAASDGYEKILQDWMMESLKPATKAAEAAILKVFALDTPQKGWSNTEWAVFIARAIMYRADHISIYDLYLLHEIMMRCQEDAE